MSKLAETLDEAVARIVWEKTDLCGKQAEDCKAAIRQGIAWAYRDIIERAQTNGYPILADNLEQRLKEIDRG